MSLVGCDCLCFTPVGVKAYVEIGIWSRDVNMLLLMYDNYRVFVSRCQSSLFKRTVLFFLGVKLFLSAKFFVLV